MAVQTPHQSTVTPPARQVNMKIIAVIVVALVIVAGVAVVLMQGGGDDGGNGGGNGDGNYGDVAHGGSSTVEGAVQGWAQGLNDEDIEEVTKYSILFFWETNATNQFDECVFDYEVIFTSENQTKTVTDIIVYPKGVGLLTTLQTYNAMLRIESIESMSYSSGEHLEVVDWVVVDILEDVVIEPCVDWPSGYSFSGTRTIPLYQIDGYWYVGVGRDANFNFD